MGVGFAFVGHRGRSKFLYKGIEKFKKLSNAKSITRIGIKVLKSGKRCIVDYDRSPVVMTTSKVSLHRLADSLKKLVAEEGRVN